MTSHHEVATALSELANAITSHETALAHHIHTAQQHTLNRIMLEETLKSTDQALHTARLALSNLLVLLQNIGITPLALP